MLCGVVCEVLSIIGEYSRISFKVIHVCDA